jgi:uncharacterized protein (TIGR02145 family)
MSDSITGPAVYQETHNVETNSYGLIRLAIGTGTVISGIFSQIGWDITHHYLKVEIDPDAGDNYNGLGTTQLISVPYALESKHTSSLTLTDENGRKYEISVDTKGTIIAEREWLCGDTLNDARDLQVYPTVQIGNQCWFKENLNLGKMIISTQSGCQQSDNDTIEKYCYNNDSSYCDTFGGLYEWWEAMQYATTEGAQGICPAGWHIPTDTEWTILVDFLGESDIAGGSMKSTGTLEAGTGLWQSPNTGATNSSGFTALPGGQRYDDYGFFVHLSGYTLFWSSTESKDWLGNAWYRSLNYYATEIIRYYYECAHGISIRCLRDCAPQPTQSDAGPYQLNLQDTSTTLDGNVPSVGTGVWHIVSGTGGIISDTLNPSSGFQGLAGNFYTLSWTISTVCRSSVDTVVISFAFPLQPCPGIPTVTYEGQTYNTVQIGVQCWLKENLNVGTMINSYQGGQLQTDNDTIEKYCLGNNSAYCDIYGGLYEWKEAMQYDSTEGVQGICPAGWHIPTNWEWTLLANHLGGASVAGGKMKTTGTIQAGTGLWYTPNVGATNESNFTGLPVGARYHGSGNLDNEGYLGFFWSSLQKNSGFAWGRNLDYNYANLNRDNYNMASGYSIRCLRDCDTPPSQSDAGPNQLNIQGTSTLLAGNTPESGTGVWHIESGSGGTIADTLSPTSEFQGLAGSVYSLTWTISTVCAISVDTVMIGFADTTQSCPGIPSVTYEGQTYTTVLIGAQCWLKENLNVGTMIISNTGGQLQTDNGVIEKYCYGNNAVNCDTYGGLYEWNEAMQYVTTEGAQGICPDGWHIPTDEQWTMLTNFLGGSGVAGGKMKSTGTIEDGTGLWYEPNMGATNESGFTGLPGGFRKHDNGDTDGLGWYGYFWSSSQKNTNIAWGRGLEYNYASVNRGDYYKNDGFSIRCLKDD